MISNCQFCNSERLIRFSGKCKDQCTIEIPHLKFEYNGYSISSYFVSDVDNGGDNLALSFCLECGKVQSYERMTDDEILKCITDDPE